MFKTKDSRTFDSHTFTRPTQKDKSSIRQEHEQQNFQHFHNITNLPHFLTINRERDRRKRAKGRAQSRNTNSKTLRSPRQNVVSRVTGLHQESRLVGHSWFLSIKNWIDSPLNLYNLKVDFNRPMRRILCALLPFQ
jgi:hypothetical protein